MSDRFEELRSKKVFILEVVGLCRNDTPAKRFR